MAGAQRGFCMGLAFCAVRASSDGVESAWKPEKSNTSWLSILMGFGTNRQLGAPPPATFTMRTKAPRPRAAFSLAATQATYITKPLSLTPNIRRLQSRG
eukprot:10054404-Karenia_brevis.AAC.1